MTDSGAGPGVRRTDRPGVRLARAALVVGAFGLSACGDPVVVVGDLPGVMRVVAGVAADADAGTGNDATRTELSGPRGIVVSPAGLLYVVDGPARSILEVHPTGTVRTVLDHRACTGEACLSRPEAVALDGRGNALVSDPSRGRVWRVPLDGGTPELVAGDPQGVPARSGGVATATALAEPAGVAGGLDGSVYLTERAGHRVWRVEAVGVLTLVAGSEFAGDRDGEARLARFTAPAGLQLHGGLLYVADQGNHRIKVIDLERATVTSVAGTGRAAFSGDGGPASGANLRSPESIAVTPDGTALYIADKGNHRIRRVTLPTGVITTFAGTGDASFTGSGREAGTTAVASPTGVATLAGSFLFVADNGNRLIWRTPLGL